MIAAGRDFKILSEPRAAVFQKRSRVARAPADIIHTSNLPETSSAPRSVRMRLCDSCLLTPNLRASGRSGRSSSGRRLVAMHARQVEQLNLAESTPLSGSQKATSIELLFAQFHPFSPLRLVRWAAPSIEFPTPNVGTPASWRPPRFAGRRPAMLGRAVAPQDGRARGPRISRC